MAALRRCSLFIPQYVQCRHRGKINVKRPRPGPIERRVFEAITKPIILDDLEDPNKQCSRINRPQLSVDKELSQYERIYVREVEQIFKTHRMIAVCHLQYLRKQDEISVKNKLLNKGLHLKFMSNSHVRTVIEDSKFANLLPLVQGRNMYVISKEPRPKELIKELKKYPHLILLGGVLEDRLLNKQGFVDASELPSHDLLLGETCAILGSHAQKTHSLLSSHQQTLSLNLERYIQDHTNDSKQGS